MEWSSSGMETMSSRRVSVTGSDRLDDRSPTRRKTSDIIEIWGSDDLLVLRDAGQVDPLVRISGRSHLAHLLPDLRTSSEPRPLDSPLDRTETRLGRMADLLGTEVRMMRGHVKAQSTLRTDGKETLTIKIIGWTPDDIDELLVELDPSMLAVIGAARLAERRRSREKY